MKNRHRKHATRRIRERIGGNAQELCDRLLASVRDGSAETVEKQSNTRTMFRVLLDGEPVVFIYSRQSKQVVTCWPERVGQ